MSTCMSVLANTNLEYAIRPLHIIKIFRYLFPQIFCYLNSIPQHVFLEQVFLQYKHKFVINVHIKLVSVSWYRHIFNVKVEYSILVSLPIPTLEWRIGAIFFRTGWFCVSCVKGRLQRYLKRYLFKQSLTFSSITLLSCCRLLPSSHPFQLLSSPFSLIPPSLRLLLPL